MKIGFTGTRRGLTPAQKDALLDTLISLAPETVEAHHGMCVGADDEFDHLVRDVYDPANRRIVGHPPEDQKHYAPAVCDVMWSPKPYLERNKNIVYKCEALIACPDGPEKRRSGTWSTVRHARSSRKPVFVIWPNGSVGRQ
jgi:hypothetical protein